MISFLPPTEGSSTATSPPVCARDRIGRAQVEIRLHQNQLDVLAASSVLISSSVWLGRGRNAGLRLHVVRPRPDPKRSQKFGQER